MVAGCGSPGSPAATSNQLAIAHCSTSSHAPRSQSGGREPGRHRALTSAARTPSQRLLRDRLHRVHERGFQDASGTPTLHARQSKPRVTLAGVYPLRASWWQPWPWSYSRAASSRLPLRETPGHARAPCRNGASRPALAGRHPRTGRAQPGATRSGTAPPTPPTTQPLHATRARLRPCRAPRRAARRPASERRMRARCEPGATARLAAVTEAERECRTLGAQRRRRRFALERRRR